MLSLASFSGLTRSAVRLLWIAGAIVLTVYVTAAAGGPGDSLSDGYARLFLTLFLAPAALCLLRAVLVREQRLAWAACGIGIACWGGGAVYYYVALRGVASPPFPSVADALLLSYYGASFVGLCALLKSGHAKFRASVWIDAAVGGLAIAAIAAAVLVKPIVASTGGGAAAATTLAYPLCDVVIIVLLLGVFANSNRRPGRIWSMLGTAWAVQAAVDIAYRYEAASGTYEPGTLLAVSWPALMLLIAIAAWQKPTVTARVWTPGWGALGVTITFAVVGLSLTTYAHWHEIDDVALILATLALVAAFVRTVTTFSDMRTLSNGRELLLQNKMLLDSAGEGIFGIDATGTVTFANPAAARMTQYTPDKLAGRSLHRLVLHTKVDGTPYPPEECPMLASLVDGAIHRCYHDVCWRQDGTAFPVEYTSTPIVDGTRIKGAVVVLRDATDRREVERVKDEFTSVVSHELRTPLTSIRGSLGLLESGVLGPLPEKGRRMIQIAVENTDRLVRLINDILDVERIDSGEMHLRVTRCDAGHLIARATEAVMPVAADAGVTLAVDAAPGTFPADADRLIQTLTNLISNAVKFSPRGGSVRVTSERRDSEMVFRVTDRGRGIPIDRLETIFERFQQVDASDSREKGGTGLGLAICRSIVELHGGRIWAQSNPGQGSTFSFVVPAPLHASEAYAPRAEDGPGPSVLVCDDDPGILEVTSTALEEHGYRVTPVRCGQVAVERAIADGPDVIVLDLLIPGMHGWEVVDALAEHPQTVHIPIVILSVLPRSESEMSRGAVVDWIEKPAAEGMLVTALERALGSRDDIFRVLFVEGEPILAGVLSAIFERHGVESYAAADGREAIERCQAVLPDLLVLDVGLPDIDGIGVVDWLRLHERLSAVPMVVYTARDLEDADRERLILGSITHFLTKRQGTSEEFERRVASLTQDRPRELHHEPEAHSAGR
jgi:PAS domain S-box-containing protein